MTLSAQPDFSSIHDFDTLMYVCQTEFDFMPVWALLNIWRATHLDRLVAASFALITLVVLSALFVRHCVAKTPEVAVARKGNSQTRSESSHDGAVGVDDEYASHFVDGAANNWRGDGFMQRRAAAWLFIGAQAVAFAIYAITVERFTVLLTPVIALMVSTLASDHLLFAAIGLLWRLARWLLRRRGPLPPLNCARVADMRVAHTTVTYVLVALLAWHSRGNLDGLRAPTTVPVQMGVQRQAELMTYIRSNAPTNASYSASMPLASAIRFATGRAIAMHPQYEDAETRRRIKQVYQMYGLKVRMYVLVIDEVACLRRVI
jgi:hypothetical protein